MQTDQHVFHKRYRGMDTDALLHIHRSGELLPEAASALLAVLRERGVLDEESQQHVDDGESLHGHGEDSDAATSRPDVKVGKGNPFALFQARKDGAVSLAAQSRWRLFHQILWLYFAVLIVAFVWSLHGYAVGDFGRLIADSLHMGIGSGRVVICLSLMFQALGLLCYYCFMQNQPSFSRPFWILFALFFFLKSSLPMFLVWRIAMHISWADGEAIRLLFIRSLNVLLYVPLLIVIAKYAFGSREMWLTQRLVVASG